jgi:hypothetical protein
MSKLSPFRVGDDRFSLDQALGVAVDPSADLNQTPGLHMMSQAHPKFCGQRRQPSCGNGLRHRFIEHGADDSSMNDSTESFGKYFGNPFRDRLTGFTGFEPEAEAVRVFWAAGKACVSFIISSCLSLLKAVWQR